ncbi:DUF5050 domain-containing protein [Clostridium sp. DJ247]|uniref:DUF5050 domain-containing protein n=1 Tax=Clostridium sp. DJ247 TaxID=2726188 RepID=UPI0016287101|nr:DUF5050 domain-containing protein [Clostridium sp. DJ247]MBC2578824.1 DUF5050 domain-containing protein [Clostridium sp. DJ247]
MTKYKKYYFVLIIFIFLFTGCENPLSSSNNKQSSTSPSTTKNSASKNSTLPTINSGVNAPNASIIVGPSNVGASIKFSSVIQAGNTLYYSNWSDKDKIYKINADGTGKQKISDDSASELILSNNTIYYSNKSDSYKIYSINTDGTGRKKLLDERTYNLILLGTFIYYIGPNNTIYALDVSNGSKSSLNIQSRCFDSDGTNIYYEDYLMNGSLSSIQINGTNKTKISDDAPMDIVVQAKVIYYSNAGDGNKLYKVSSDGTNKTKLNDFKSMNLVLDNGWIYYINDSDYDKIYKIKLDGTNNTKVSDESFVKSFSIAGNFIYFNKKTDSTSAPFIYKISK